MFFQKYLNHLNNLNDLNNLIHLNTGGFKSFKSFRCFKLFKFLNESESIICILLKWKLIYSNFKAYSIKMDSDDSQKELERRYLKDKLKVNIIKL